MTYLLYSICAASVIDAFDDKETAVAVIRSILVHEPEAEGNIALEQIGDDNSTIATWQGADLVAFACLE